MTFGAGFGFPRARFPMGAAPTLNMDFAGTAALPPYVTFSRGTNATYVDSLGNIAYAPSNLLTYSEQFDNAVWVKGLMVVTANAAVAPNGSTTADLIDAATETIAVYPTQSVTVANSTTYTLSTYVKEGTAGFLRFRTSVVAGSLSIWYDVVNRTFASAGPGLLGLDSVDVGGGWYRVAVQITYGASDGGSRGISIVPVSSSGGTVAFGTVYLWGAQLNLDGLQPYNSTTVNNLLGYTQDFDNAAWTKSNSFIQTNLLTYSEQFENAAWTKSNSFIQTNQIRNNTMQGAVAGSPGTMPNNWGVSLAGGLTREVVGTGSVEGVTYIDLRVFGTTTNTNLALNLRFDLANQITAATGQAWAESVWVQAIGGSTTGVAYAYLTVVELSSAGVDLAYLSGSTFLPTINTFIRRTHSVTTSNAATAFVAPTLWMGHVGVGAVIDITLRIGLPQLVQGAVPGDVVRTYGTAMPVMYPSPIGTVTADKFVEAVGSVAPFASQSPAFVAGTPYSFTCYAKEDPTSAKRYLMLLLPSGAFGSNIRGVFDLDVGTFTTTGTATVSMENLGNGWWRCRVTATASTTVSSGLQIRLSDVGTGSVSSYTGDGTSGIYIWGAQIVQGATPGDYQATTTAALAVQYRAPDGSLTADKLVEDTATSSHFLQSVSLTAQTGTTYTFSCYAKAAGRSKFELLAYALGLTARGFDLSNGTTFPNTAGLSEPTTSSITLINDGWYRCSVTANGSGVSSTVRAYLNNGSTFSYTGDGTSGIYIWGAQLSDSASLDPYSYNFTTAPTAAAYYGPRFDYDPVTLACKGLLIEEQRTNSIRNNTMQGAVAGSPGTVPTNWGVTNLGLTQTIVGTGTENGITYIDIRLNGTTTGQFGNVRFEPNNSVTASSGQTWTVSSYLKLIAGSLANLSEVGMVLYSFTSAPAFISSSNTGAAVNADLTRFDHVGTLPATTAFVQPAFYFNTTAASGQAIDITLRIGLPQLELGAFATSVIPTTTTAVTRAADVAVIQGANFSNWYNQSEGTLFAEFDVVGYALSGAFPTTTAFSDGTNNNRMLLANANTGGNLYSFYEISTGGVTQVGLYGATGASFGAGTPRKVTGTYMDNNFAFTTQGVSVQTDSLGTVPPANRLNLGVNAVGNGNYLNGHIARIAYYPTRQPDPTLQAITTT